MSESTLVKIPYCWKSHVTAQLYNGSYNINPCHAEYYYVLHSSPIFILLTNRIPVLSMFPITRVENSVDPVQMAADLDLQCFFVVFLKKRKNPGSAGQG